MSSTLTRIHLPSGRNTWDRHSAPRRKKEEEEEEEKERNVNSDKWPPFSLVHTHTHTHTQPELATTDQKKKSAHSVAFLRPESVTFNLKIPIDRKLLFHIPVSPFPTKLNAIPLLSLSKLNQLTLGNWTKKKSLSFKMMKRKKKKRLMPPCDLAANRLRLFFFFFFVFFSETPLERV